VPSGNPWSISFERSEQEHSAVTIPHPRPPRHLHVFGISLLLIVGMLCAFLFGVKMEATVQGAGTVTSSKIVQLRAPRTGKVYIAGLDGESPTSPDFEPIVAGTTLYSGKAVVWLGGEMNIYEPILAPSSLTRWMVLELPIENGHLVQEGELVASLVQVNAEASRVLDLVVRIEIDEQQFGSVESGQEVRLYSNMHPHRTHGFAKGVIDRLEPMGVEGPNGSRKFHAWAKVTECPFPLKLGSSVRAEVVVGRKRTYQIILEH
jgi:hypothetical protein